MAQVSLAWCFSKPGTDLHKLVPLVSHWLLGVTAPIVGTTSLKNLEELIGMIRSLHYSHPDLSYVVSETPAAVHLTLTEEEISYLEEPYEPQAIQGHM